MKALDLLILRCGRSDADRIASVAAPLIDANLTVVLMGGSDAMAQLMARAPDAALPFIRAQTLALLVPLVRTCRERDAAEARVAELEAEVADLKLEVQLRDAGEPPAVDLRGSA